MTFYIVSQRNEWLVKVVMDWKHQLITNFMQVSKSSNVSRKWYNAKNKILVKMKFNVKAIHWWCSDTPNVRQIMKKKDLSKHSVIV